MPQFNHDEECDLCLGTGWVIDTPIVEGQNEDGTDILSEPRFRMCRCAWVNESDPEEEDEDWDDENLDEEEDPFPLGGVPVLA